MKFELDGSEDFSAWFPTERAMNFTDSVDFSDMNLELFTAQIASNPSIEGYQVSATADGRLNRVLIGSDDWPMRGEYFNVGVFDAKWIGASSGISTSTDLQNLCPKPVIRSASSSLRFQHSDSDAQSQPQIMISYLAPGTRPVPTYSIWPGAKNDVIFLATPCIFGCRLSYVKKTYRHLVNYSLLV